MGDSPPRPRDSRWRRRPSDVGAILAIAAAVAVIVASTASAGQPDKVHCQMGYTWAVGPYYAGYLIGVKQGFYAKHGIDVSFTQGAGSSTTLQLLANGQIDFGCAVATGALINLVSQGAKIKMVAGTVPASSLSILSKKSEPITRPSQLIGKTIGIPPGGEQAQLWPAFLKASKLSTGQIKQIKIASLGGDALPLALKTGRIDAYVTSWLDVPGLAEAGIPVARLDFASQGVQYSPMEGVDTTDAMIAKNPGLVRRFVAAVRESWAYAIKHPVATADYYVSQHPTVPKAFTLGDLLEVTGALKKQGGPFAKLNNATWIAAINLLKKYEGLKNAAPPSAYSTFDRFTK